MLHVGCLLRAILPLDQVCVQILTGPLCTLLTRATPHL